MKTWIRITDRKARRAQKVNCIASLRLKQSYIVYDNFVWNNNYRKLEPTLYSQSMHRNTLLSVIIIQVALWHTNKEANLEQWGGYGWAEVALSRDMKYASEQRHRPENNTKKRWLPNWRRAFFLPLKVWYFIITAVSDFPMKSQNDAFEHKNVNVKAK